MIYKYFIIKKEDVNQRLDNFCKKKIKNLTKNMLYSLLRKCKIKVNNFKITFFYKLQQYDFVKIYDNLKFNIQNNTITQPSIKLIKFFQDRILYEDNYLLVLNKPGNIAVHGGTNIKLNIIHSLRLLNPSLELIHRLDKETSGILICSKNHKILKDIALQFVNKLIKKKYIVLVHGIFIQDKTINLNIKKNGNLKKMIVNKNGKLSTTIFKVIKYYSKFTLLEAETFSGKTHQIRLHLSHLGYPIVHDNIYGCKKKDNLLTLNRLFLHASYILFYHSIYNKYIELTSPLDLDLFNFINKFIN